MGSICHIAKLPVELLELIFNHLIVATRQDPLVLCDVCLLWHTIIGQRPRYWRTLLLRSTTTLPKMEQRIKLAGKDIRRLFVYGMQSEKFIGLASTLRPALENVNEVYFEASYLRFYHLYNALSLQCSPRILTLQGVQNGGQPTGIPLRMSMMSNKLTELYISSFNPDWSTFLGLTPFLKVLHVSDGGLPPHFMLTKVVIRLPRLETLFLDGAIMPSNRLRQKLPNPLPAVLPSVRELEVRLRPETMGSTIYWLSAPAQARQLQCLRLEGCRLRWLRNLLTPLVPPLVQLYLHFPRDELDAQDLPVHLGRTLERFAFTDTPMQLDSLVPLLVASEKLQWLNLSRTSVDNDILRRFLVPRGVGGENAITTLIVHGCQRLGMDASACVQGYVITLEVEAPSSP